MNKPNIAQYLSELSIPVGDMDLLENFHESTKYHPSTIKVDSPRIIEYLTSSRAILETSQNVKSYVYSKKICLPKAQPCEGGIDGCLKNRRTAMEFNHQAVGLQSLANVLHASIAPTKTIVMGENDVLEMNLRPYASGGGLYPIEVYPILLDYEEGKAVITHYHPFKHELSVINTFDRDVVLSIVNDLDGRLARSSVIFMFTGVMPRVTVKYGARGHRFALLEAGHVCQNLSLTAVDSGLSTLPWGGFYDDKVADLLNIDNVDEIILHCMALGHEAKQSEAGVS